LVDGREWLGKGRLGAASLVQTDTFCVVGCVRSDVAGLEPIWHVIVGGERRGPLTEDQMLAYLGDGTLVANDFVWCPDFSDWKRAGEIGDNRPLGPVPAQAVVEPSVAAQDDWDNAFPDDADPGDEAFETGVSAAGAKWSLWKSANIGLLVSALTLLLLIGREQGFELAQLCLHGERGDDQQPPRPDPRRAADLCADCRGAKPLEPAAVGAACQCGPACARLRRVAGLYLGRLAGVWGNRVRQHRRHQRRGAKIISR
jgi:hypothetical protein